MNALGTGATRVARAALASTLAEALSAGHVLLVAGAGYGKTMALEETLELAGRRAVWLSGEAAGGQAGRLLIAAVHALRAVAPGLADVAGDRIAAGLEPVDVRTAAGALLADVEQLLSEPLTVVIDDAERLEGDPDALMLVEQMLNVRGVPLTVAIASRRPLPLRLAKLRARGRLVELGPAELSFTAAECEEVLRLRHGRPVAEDEVAAVLAVSEGWPMGVALSGLVGASPDPSGGLSRDALFAYLAEEVLEGLDPDTRTALIDSSVVATLDPDISEALGLPDGFLDEAARQGLFLREHASGGRSYHPVFRTFLLERLYDLRSPTHRATLHARAAARLAASGRPADAVEHWIAAGRFAEALDALVLGGGELIRMTPGKVRDWLAGLPPELRQAPDYHFLDGQLLWGAGEYARAQAALRDATSGYAASGDPDRAWLARIFLADTLVLDGGYAAMVELADGWEDVASPLGAFAARSVAWYAVSGLASLGRLDEADALRTRLCREPEAAAPFAFIDALTRAGIELAAGQAQAALARMRSAVGALEASDPFGRLPYALAGVLMILRDLGDRQAALATLDACEAASEALGQVFGPVDFRAQRASLLAHAGDLSGAEVVLAQVPARRGVWRGMFQAEAEAEVALLRGDGPAAIVAAERAVASASTAPPPWRVRCTIDMAAVLVAGGASASARSAVERALAGIDAIFPGERGRHHRAWLLAVRASLAHAAGEVDSACAVLRAAWDQAGDEAGLLVRARWPAIQPVLWQALGRQTIDPREALPAIDGAGAGEHVVLALIDHPEPVVRRAALRAALDSGHPPLLGRLKALERDGDDQVAAAAVAARERLRVSPPPLRFELLGGFRVRRAGWELPDAVWQRPMVARVVRFLLLHDGAAVPEDELFEAFWPDRPRDVARPHLAVAVSRARKVLDLPDVERSVIEHRERTYRLGLKAQDSIDAVEFRRAAEAALATRGGRRAAALERACALWTGEPLPEDRYAGWTAAWRAELVECYSHLLSALVDEHAAHGRDHEAIDAARRLLAVDPHDEHAHRRLMVSYAHTGRTSYALRQYLECRRALVVDLGIEPAIETSRLQARILAGEPV